MLLHKIIFCNTFHQYTNTIMNCLRLNFVRNYTPILVKQHAKQLYSVMKQCGISTFESVLAAPNRSDPSFKEIDHDIFKNESINGNKCLLLYQCKQIEIFSHTHIYIYIYMSP